MAQVTQLVLAAEKFLSGLRGLAKYEELRDKQAERLLKTIPKQTVSLSEAGSLVSSLRADIWGEQHVTSLKEVLATSVEGSVEAVEKPRVRLQDYTALFHYLDQAWWSFLLDGKGRRSKSLALEQLCKLCLLLGCKNPTEKTFAAILILVHCLDAGESISEPEKFQILQANKPAMKKIFLSAGEGGSFLEKLPLDVSECPAEILATAYPKGFRRFEPEGVDLVQLRVLTETFPLRKTNRAAPAHQLALQTGGHGGVDLIKGLFSLYDRARSSGSLEEKQSSDLPGFRLLQKTKRATAIADSKAELPLEDTKQVESPPATAAMASGTLQSSGAKQDELVEQKPEALIASLKAGLESEKKDGLCPKKKDRKKATSPKKKPAGKKGLVLKRPAAFQPSAGSEPGQSGKGKGPKKRTSDQMAKARESLFTKIPAELQDKYRSGCSSCRQRPFCTVSCWAKRGYFP